MSGYLIDNNVWTAHEKGYPDFVNFVYNLIEDNQVLYMNRIIQMELLSFSESTPL
jgi:hypothetical protein